MIITFQLTTQINILCWYRHHIYWHSTAIFYLQRARKFCLTFVFVTLIALAFRGIDFDIGPPYWREHLAGRRFFALKSHRHDGIYALHAILYVSFSFMTRTYKKRHLKEASYTGETRYAAWWRAARDVDTLRWWCGIDRRRNVDATRRAFDDARRRYFRSFHTHATSFHLIS